MTGTNGSTAPEAAAAGAVWLRRLVNFEAGEAAAVLLAFAYFFSLLCGYYILRPIRDAMGIAGGVEHLHWLFTGTFVAMLALVPLFGWLSSRYPRRRLLPYVYYFFIANLLGFFLLFKWNVTHAWVARAFYIWVSVFNLFVVSVFWSLMIDIFRDEQAKRLFGFIAAGGTAGAIAGPFLTASLVGLLGQTNLLLVSAGFLAVTVVCINALDRWSKRGSGASKARAGAVEQGLKGGIWAGIRLVVKSPYLLGICALFLLYTSLSTFLYFQQAQIVRDAVPDATGRTEVFAKMDLAVNVLTALCQVFFTARIVSVLGVAWSLAAIPLFLIVGFVGLAWAPGLPVLVVVQVLRRAGDYALMRPCREMLYVVLSREEKYKAKNFIDTAVYRGGDALSAWVYAGFTALSLGLSQIALIGAAMSGLWAWVAYTMGRKHDALAGRERV
jgi:AAA family ATP:ADP antiporter